MMTKADRQAFILVFVCAAILLTFILCSAFSWDYTRRDCEVVKVIGNDVYVVDEGGRTWKFEGRGYRVGEKVDLRMDDNGTPNTITDDTIKAVK